MKKIRSYLKYCLPVLVVLCVGKGFSLETDLDLQNLTVTAAQGAVYYQAENSITAGSSVVIESGADAVFEAVGVIRLTSGFTAADGSRFRASTVNDITLSYSNLWDAGKGSDLITQDWTQMSFQKVFVTSPIVLVDMQTFSDTDSASTRIQNVWMGSLEVKIEEEQSFDSETTHVAEMVGYVAFEEGLLIDSVGQLIGETGKVVRGQSDRSVWYTVALNETYIQPVVLMQIDSFNESAPAHIRLRNVGSNSFEYKIEEWDYQDGVHVSETLVYYVIEQGIHQLADGTLLDVGILSMDDNWITTGFTQNFISQPVVFSQCQTLNEIQAVVTRQNNITSSGFDVRLQEEENNDGVHAIEMVGYLAVEMPVQRSDLIAQRTTDSVIDDWYPVNFNQSFKNNPVVIGSIDTFDDADSAGLRLQSLTNTSAQLKIEEEISLDAEIGHTSEVISYLAAKVGPLKNSSGIVIGDTGQFLWAQPDGLTWGTLNLQQSYINPVVFMQIMSSNDNDPAHIRLRNIGGNTVDYQIEEWDYQDGIHASETIGYIVVEQGVYILADGTVLEAGFIDGDQQWTNVNFSQNFISAPVILSRSQTFNDMQAVVTRHRNLTPTGFQIMLQEEEISDGIHALETIGYMAMGFSALSIPVSPVLNSAVPVNMAVDLSWSNIDYATEYKIKYGTTIGSYDTTINVGNVTNYSVSRLTNGTTYYFVASAFNAAGDSPDSTALNATPQIPPPPLTPVVTDDGVYTTQSTLLYASWDFQTDITEYLYAIGTSNTTMDIVPWTSVGTQTDITRTGLVLIQGQSYYFLVKAKNTTGSWSDVGTSDGIIMNQSAPVITSVEIPSGNTGYLEDDFSISVMAGDSEGDALLYQFSIDDTIIQPWQLSNSFLWTTTGVNPGVYTLKVDVNDGNGGQAAQTAGICLFRKPPDAPQP